jgi:hypothetical protein
MRASDKGKTVEDSRLLSEAKAEKKDTLKTRRKETASRGWKNPE